MNLKKENWKGVFFSLKNGFGRLVGVRCYVGQRPDVSSSIPLLETFIIPSLNSPGSVIYALLTLAEYWIKIKIVGLF